MNQGVAEKNADRPPLINSTNWQHKQYFAYRSTFLREPYCDKTAEVSAESRMSKPETSNQQTIHHEQVGGKKKSPVCRQPVWGCFVAHAIRFVDASYIAPP
ncbi:hypothetical protein PQR02_38740 [Paraburkholderia sediminicola]|uniref:Uncharacterized protein n=1 Tax=Paraburkholderia rhynchosiae TaxID=487049 RepID=A0ACC7NNN7_9BURK